MKKWMGRLKWQKISRILVKLVVAVIFLALSLVVAINIPSIQTFLAGKIVREIREKTGTGLQATLNWKQTLNTVLIFLNFSKGRCSLISFSLP